MYTGFLLMLCLTGLPPIVHDEIDAALNPDQWKPANPGGPLLTLDEILEEGRLNRPGEVPIFMSFDIDRPVVNVTTGSTPSVPSGQMYFASFDQTSGELVPPADVGESVMHFILQLHTDMFLGRPGMLFLGAMGFVFVVAIVSGAVLCTPFMRRLDFGTVRIGRAARTKWLDYHNFLGIVSVGWALVVGLTGVVNALEKPIIDYWRQDAVADLIAQAGGATAPLVPTASLDEAVAAAKAAAPSMDLRFVAFPGGSYSTGQHYAIFLRGRTPLTVRMSTPVLVHAQTGRMDGLRQMPWYVRILAVSRPLHFGDYGGLALKIIWFLLTLLTIVVLSSGLYLWFAGGRRSGSGGKGLPGSTRLTS